MFLSKLFKRKSTKLVALLGAFSMMLGVGAMLSFGANSHPAIKSNAEGTSFYLVGDGSFLSGSTKWSETTGLQMSSMSGNKGVLLNQYLEAGDIFQIKDTSSDTWYGWNKNDSATDTTHFEHTAYNSADGLSYKLVIKAHNLSSWFPAGGTSWAHIFNSDSDKYGNWKSDKERLTRVPNTDYYYIEVVASKTYSKLVVADSSNQSDADWDMPDMRTEDCYQLNSCSNQKFYGQRIWSGQSTNIRVKTSGFYNIYLNSAGKIYISTVSSFTPGEAAYLDMGTVSSTWTGDEAIIGAHFWNTSNTGVSKDVAMTEVHEHGGSTSIYEAIIPSGMSAGDPNRIIFMRLNPAGQASAGGSGWWVQLPTTGKYHLVWNQTQDLSYDFANNKYLLSGSQAGDGKYLGSWNSAITKIERAEYFGTYFNTHVVCDGQGSRTTDNWSATQTEYENMCTNAQGVVWVSPAVDGSADELKKAVSKYDDIIYKHGKDKDTSAQIGIIDATHVDYVNRHTSDAYSGDSSKAFYAGRMPSANSPLTTTLWIVLGAGLAGLTAIGTAYFVSKKKKYRA